MPMYVRITKAALDLESDLARKTTSDGFKYGPVTRTIYGLPIVNKDAYDKLHENLRSLGFSKRADDHKTYSHFGDISMSLGYDGIVLRNTKMDGGGDLNNHYIVFSPTGAKSATGNNGYWSDESESIVEQKPHDGQKKQEYTGKPRIDRIIKALAGLAPNLTITIAKTQEEYAALVKGLDKKVASGWGVFYRDANGRPRIVVNSSAPNVANTLFHEASHPIIAALAHSRPDLFQKFYNEAIKADGGKYERYGNLYKDKSTQVQQEEAIVQYVADILSAIANKKIPVSTRKDSLYQQVKAFIQDILAALGWDTRNIDLSKPDNVREMAGQIAKALEKGIKITGLTPSANSKGEAYLKADADRLVNGWYSRLRDAVNSKGRTQPASEWKNWIAARAKEGAFSL